MRTYLASVILLSATVPARATEPCQTIHGRASYSSTNGMFRIWHIGTHHTFMPDEERNANNTDFSPSWNKVYDVLTVYGRHEDDYFLFADFVVCPTETFHEGASQPATVKRVMHPHLVKRTD